MAKGATNMNLAVGAMAVDGYGNLFFTTSEDGAIHTLPASEMAKGSQSTETLYSAESASVRGPAGIVADGFFLYWANRQGDTTSGVVARAPERRTEGSVAPEVLAANSDLYQEIAVNVCLARDNLFFTGESEYLFAVKSAGGMIANVSRAFSAPKGCAYDGESTLYVADAGSNAVYSLPANMAALRPIRHVSKVASVEGPDQIAIFHSSDDGLMEQVIHTAGAVQRAPGGLALTASLAAAAAACSA